MKITRVIVMEGRPEWVQRYLQADNCHVRPGKPFVCLKGTITETARSSEAIDGINRVTRTLVYEGKAENSSWVELSARRGSIVTPDGSVQEISRAEERDEEPSLMVHCVCGEDYSMHMHTVCPHCFRFPKRKA